jgi:hypothetical protein
MKKLQVNWLSDGLIDFEYKKYLLLDYLQSVKTEFDGQRLYPVFSELIMHYQNLLQLKENKKLVYEQFPQQISRSDFEKLELVYQKMVEDDETMQELEDIIQFATPLFSEAVNTGKEIYQTVERHLEITPVGITPMYFSEGYLFLEEYWSQETKIYFYKITIFKNTYEQYRGIHTHYLDTVRRSLSLTYENLKLQLARSNHEFPNPATFAVIARARFPFEHSVLPIAKRALVKYVSTLGNYPVSE